VTGRAAVLLLAVAAAGCDSVDRVNRPLPEDLSLKGLDGARVDRRSFDGRAWVLSLWLPG
jgi:hypothetical protein